MTPEEINLVQSSFRKVAPIADEAAQSFYGKLFELDPDTEDLFTGDMKEQGRKLMKTLKLCVKGLDDLPSIVGAVQELGERHVDYGVQEKDYDTVGQALIYMLGECIGPEEFTPEVKGAWLQTYYLLAATMKDAAAKIS
jgi:hemoglobin-like flavoprotein